MSEITPAFGTDLGQFDATVGQLLDCKCFDNIYLKMGKIINQLKESETIFSKSILLFGNKFAGKTTIASKLAIDSSIPLVRMINGESLLGYSSDNLKSS